jgi:hypothetical protein
MMLIHLALDVILALDQVDIGAVQKELVRQGARIR